ncbi:MAG: hypothetical protein A2213_04290 [Lysobacterales bacterium RIFOXYA1_FULL_68_6]|nr:MAG: hypothetical protein A2213_04290 [Xanthomonadales bacterium RIFOXYA1_FULL_68_6]
MVLVDVLKGVVALVLAKTMVGPERSTRVNMDSRRCKVLALQKISEIRILGSEIFEEPVPGWLQDSGQCLNLSVFLDEIGIIVVGLRDSVASCGVAVQIYPPIALVLENVVAMELEHSVDAARFGSAYIQRIVVQPKDL